MLRKLSPLLILPALLILVVCGRPDTIEEVRADCEKRMERIGKWNEEKAAEPQADHEAGKITTSELMAQLMELVGEADEMREEVLQHCRAEFERLGHPASGYPFPLD
ncbi:MAG: hypothetical protein F4X66_04055 [Chloroflexi bacterium]|nr:hypothetical protein [Chloroflexota bacterium]